MSLTQLFSIKEEYIHLALFSAIPFILVCTGLVLASYFDNTPSSFSVIQMWGIVIALFAFGHGICGSMLYCTTLRPSKMLVVGLLIIVALCVLTIMIALDFVKSVPYFEECGDLSDVSDISLVECMNTVDVNVLQTGQEVIDAIEADKVVEKVNDFEILNRHLIP